MKRNIYVIMETIYGDDEYQEIKDNKFFESEKKALDYAIATMLDDFKENAEESLIEKYYDKYEDAEEGYKPSEEEFRKAFIDSDCYEIRKLTK